MEKQKYKFSMFTKAVKCSGNEMFLYNSYLGINKIVKISKSNVQAVNDWIRSSELLYNDNPVFKKLLDMGYIIDVKVDEKMLRQNLINETLYDKRLDLIVHTTEDCNFRCEYCALDFNKRMMEPDVAESIIKYIRKNIMKYEAVSISWFGGEPLMNMQVIEQVSREVIKICAYAKRPYSASITTNGYLLNKRNMDILYNCNVRHITVTIDGIKETHDKQRHLINGGPTFDQILQNLKNIYDEKKYHVMISVRTNVTKEILDNLKAYIEFLNYQFKNDKRFGLFMRIAGDWGGERVKKIKDNLLSESAYSIIYEILKKIPNLSLNWDMNKYDFEPAGCFCQSMKKHKYTIAVDGSIHKCDSPNMPIGILDGNGNMIINDKMHFQWSLPHEIASKQCDDCFFSCACFMGTCPKNMLLNKNNYKCSGFLEGIDNIINWIATTQKIEII